MNTTRQALVQVAAAIATGWMLMPAAHANTPAEGVQCPSGSNAQISNDNRKLVCATEERIERASVCSPLVFKNNGDINLNQRIEMIEAGSDTCKAVSTGATAPSQALLLPGDVASNFHREVRAGKDVFVYMKPTFKYPEGGPIYVGNPANGVHCESGYDGDPAFGGKGIRCDRRELRKAVCDIGWSIDRNTGTDKCFIEQVVFGNKGRVDGQYTIPAGTTGITGNPETHGWDLKKDHIGNVDYWAKEAKDYRFPTSL
jgi:hypothetical protein